MLALPSDEPLSGLCRVCAADGEPLTDIFDHHQRLRNKIQVCLRIIVNETDHYPNTLCGPCAARLDLSYDLVQRCARGQRELRRRLQAAGRESQEPKAGEEDCNDSDSNSSQGPTYANLEPLDPEGLQAMELDLSGAGNLSMLADAVEQQSRLEPGSGSSRSPATVSKELTCEYCNKVFRHTGDFNKHRRSHTGEQPYSCTVCGKRFSHISNLLRHSKIHSGERPFKCETCQRTFSRSDKLTSHTNICSRDSFTDKKS